MSAASTAAWYWNRLRCMSLAEITHRALRAAAARAERLRPIPAVPAPDLTREGQPFILADDTLPPAPYARVAEDILQGRWPLFGVEQGLAAPLSWNRDPKTGREAPLRFGKLLDYRREAVVGDIKYLWEPNRHLHLPALAQAFRLTRDRRYADAIAEHLRSWLEQCPYPLGPNWTSSLELGIRLINWSITWQLLGGLRSPIFDGTQGLQLRDAWLESIHRHLHFIRGHLSRHSSANNHLIGEAAGLLVGALTWPHWAQGPAWAGFAHALLEREVLLQNHTDGVNREQAISYQQFVLDFALLAALASRANGTEFTTAYWQRIERMLEFVASVMDVGGNVPMIGDADDGYAVRLAPQPGFCPYRSLLATGAVLFRRAEFRAKADALDDKTRWLLGPSAVAAFAALAAAPAGLPVRRAFPEGGYYILGTDFETAREVRAIVDAGPLGYLAIAAHGHADALALTLSSGGREFLIDPGTYAYHTQRRWRDYFRGTAAHNTVEVDGLDQSQIGGNFMWLHKASARVLEWASAPEGDRWVAEHDGYRRLADPVLHRRSVTFVRGARRLVVADRLECSGGHRAQCAWHFAEACTVTAAGDGLEVANDGRRVRLEIRGVAHEIHLERGQDSPPGGWVSRRFDHKMPTTTARVRFAVNGPTEIVTTIECE